jgi:hypothetical protein
MQSESRSPDQIFKSAILVEFGPVTIGNREYICPVRSAALSRLTEFSAYGVDFTAFRFVTYLNDVIFNQYRLFRGDVRILP